VSIGTVYLIGAGPGDPSLITLRGSELLKQCDVVLYDALAHPGLLAMARPSAELEFVGKRGGQKSHHQSEINERLIELARSGKSVARLKGGDPLLFARGGEEMEALAKAGVPYEVIPGVSSPIAVSAYAGIPLTHRELSSSVLFVTGKGREQPGTDGLSWSFLARYRGTICILMGMSSLIDTTQQLIAHGKDADTAVAVVQWGARSEQATVVGNLATIAQKVEQAQLGSPALIIIGPVVGLREQLRWFDSKPLFGKRILVTRAPHQAEAFNTLLRYEGAIPLSCPTIAIHPPSDTTLMENAFANLDSYDWVVFTSPNGARVLLEMMTTHRRDARVFGKAKIAVIGPGTGRALEHHGIIPDLVAKEHVGEGLGRAILEQADPGSKVGRVLLWRAQVARDALPEMLRECGYVVDVVPAYETRTPNMQDTSLLREALVRGEIDYITFTSSSTASNFVHLFEDIIHEISRHTRFASIGPITTKTLRSFNLDVHVTAQTFTLTGLIDALKRASSPEP
jgi:uroporphyrinogen III methyltransferase / synthase